jgi:hypothetical protein
VRKSPANILLPDIRGKHIEVTYIGFFGFIGNNLSNALMPFLRNEKAKTFFFQLFDLESLWWNIVSLCLFNSRYF